MKMSTVGPVNGGAAEFGEALRGAVAALGTRPRLVLLYLPIEADHAAYLATAQALDVPVVGATTGGAAFTERGYTRQGAVAAVIGGDDLAVSVSVARGVMSDPARSLREGLKSLSLPSGRQLAILTLADAFACDGEVLVAALRENTPVHCRHFGGTAGDNWRFSGTKVFVGNEVLSDAAVFVLFSSVQPLSLAVQHGWCAADGGREMTATQVEGNVLRQLDGRPAVAAYTEELIRLGLLSPGDDVVKVLAKYELGIRTPFGEQLKIRAPLAADESGAITLASSIREGSVMRVVTADPERLIGAAGDVAKKAMGGVKGGEATGALVFDCAARLQLLGEQYGEQVAAFCSAGRQPVLGMACYGEIARFAGSIEGFHNTTAVVAAFA